VKYLLLFLFLVGCGGSSSSVPPPPAPPVIEVPNDIPLFYIQNDKAGYGGTVVIKEGEAVLESNTNPDCLTVSMCRRVELVRKVELPIRFSYSFEILQWEVDEYLCGTHRGIPKGCYIILHQFWNERAAPRAYVVIQNKGEGLYKLSFHNKNDAAVVDYVWETYLGDGIHNIEIYNDGLGASLVVNGETSGYRVLDVTSTAQEYLKWGMYWQREMAGEVIIRFSDVFLEEDI